MNEEKTLIELKEKAERLKMELAQKQGSRDSAMKQIMKEFDVKSIDEAYKLLEESDGKIEVLKEQRDELLKIAEGRLEGYR